MKILKKITDWYKNNSKKSYTLVEVSVALMVASALVYSGVKGYNGYLRKQEEAQNMAKMKRIQNAMRIFFATHDRLPRPANELTRKDELFGYEYGSRNLIPKKRYFDNDKQSNDSYPRLYILYGMVPTSALGLSKDDAFDIYGNRIDYYVHEAITQLPGEGGELYRTWEKVGYERVFKSVGDYPCTRGTTQCKNDIFTREEAFYSILYRKKIQSASAVQNYFNKIMYNIKIFDLRTSGNKDLETGLTSPIKSTEHNVPYVIISHGKLANCAFTEHQTTYKYASGLKEPDEVAPVETMTMLNDSQAQKVINAITSASRYNCYYFYHQGGQTQSARTKNYNGGTSGAHKPLSFVVGNHTEEFQDIVLYDTMENLITYGASSNLNKENSNIKQRSIDEIPNFHTIPAGTAILFQKNMQPPIGWQNCDGTNGTPDLQQELSGDAKKSGLKFICKIYGKYTDLSNDARDPINGDPYPIS